MRYRVLFTSVLLIILVLSLALPTAALAQDDEEEPEPCPPGMVSMDPPATGIFLEAVTTTANLDTVLCNGTNRTMLVNLETSGLPDGWSARFRPRVGTFLITSIQLAPDQREDLQLRIRGPRDQSPADFTMTLLAKSALGDVLAEKNLRVQRIEGAPAARLPHFLSSKCPW